jgi:hypothetical protein
LKDKSALNKHRFLVLLLALALVRGLIYSAVVLPWQGPDETYHFLSAHLADLPNDPAGSVAWERLKTETAASLLEFDYWHMSSRSQEKGGLPGRPKIARLQPGKPRSLVYHIPAVWLRLIPRQDVVFQLYWSRLLSVLVSLGIIATAYATGYLVFDGVPFGTVLLPLSIILLPQHSFILSVLNDGNFAELFASLAIFLWVWGLTRGWHWTKIVGLGVFAALAVVSKPTSFYLVLAIPIWAIVRYWRRVANPKNLALGLILIGLIVAAVFLSRIKGPFLRAWRFGWHVLQGLPLEDSDALGQQVFDTLRAFWGQMGWTSRLLSDLGGSLLLLLFLLAGLGILKFLLTPTTYGEAKGPSREIIFVLGLCVLISVSHVPVYILTTEYGQTLGKSNSRYLFSAIIPIMALLGVGWRELIPRKWRIEGMALLVSFFFLFDTMALLNYGVSFFYPLWR